MVREWLITDKSEPHFDAAEEERDSVVVDSIAGAIPVLDRFRLGAPCFLMMSTTSGEFFMIGLGKSSAEVRYASAETPRCVFRLVPLTPQVGEELHYPAEQDDVRVPRSQLLTIEQLYGLLRHFEECGEFPEYVKGQYAWEEY